MGGCTASETVVLDRTAFTTSSGAPVTGSQHLDHGKAAVRIVWTTENGERSEIGYEWPGPDRTDTEHSEPVLSSHSKRR